MRHVINENAERWDKSSFHFSLSQELRCWRCQLSNCWVVWPTHQSSLWCLGALRKNIPKVGVNITCLLSLTSCSHNAHYFQCKCALVRFSFACSLCLLLSDFLMFLTTKLMAFWSIKRFSCLNFLQKAEGTLKRHNSELFKWNNATETHSLMSSASLEMFS